MNDMFKTIQVKEDVYRLLTKLKKHLGAKNFNKVIRELALKELGLSKEMFGVDGGKLSPPSQKEIKALEDHIWKFLYGKLQYRDTYAVKRWIWDDPPPGTDRSFNYPHVFNIYYSMYKIAKLYNLTEHSAKEYLLLAYHTAMTYHSDEYCEDAWRTLGNMGGLEPLEHN